MSYLSLSSVSFSHFVKNLSGSVETFPTGKMFQMITPDKLKSQKSLPILNNDICFPIYYYILFILWFLTLINKYLRRDSLSLSEMATIRLATVCQGLQGE
jgi:hypothetical protein